MSEDPPQLPIRLLVDLPNWVGDVVMALPVVARLVGGNRAGETVLHCRPPVDRLLGALFPDAAVVATPRRTAPITAARRVLAGGGRFPIGITLRHATRAKLLLLLAARHRLGSRGGGGGLLLSEAVAIDRNRAQIYDFDPIVSSLGLAQPDPGWLSAVPEPLLVEGRQALERAGVRDAGVVGLAPAAAWGRSKQWPPQRFAELADRLELAGLAPVVLVGPGEEGVAAEVAAAASSPPPVVGPELDVAALLGVLALLDAVVSNDSGPMHLAALAGVPVVALFGPTDPRRTAPSGDAGVTLSLALDCAPCFKPVCPLGHQDCLKGISAASVADAVLSLVS